MPPDKHIQMKFVCNQEWDSMKASANGRFCDQCKHEVFDFTNMSIEQINAFNLKNGAVCGNYRVEQTEDLILIEFKTFKKARYWLATITTFLGLELGKAHAQHNRLEIKPQITGIYPDTTQHTKDKTEFPAPEKPACSAEATPAATLKRMTTIGKYGLYKSNRFPFILIKKRHVKGMRVRFL